MSIRAETKERQPAATSRRSQTAIAIAALVVLEILFVILYHFGNLETHVIETIGTGLGAGVVYFVILYAFEHLPERRATL